METPTMQGLAAWYVRIKTNFPGIPAVGTKRDIDSDFTRCRIRPDAESMFPTEFLAEEGAIDVGFIFIYMVPRFGFTGSPVIFGRVTQGENGFTPNFLRMALSGMEYINFGAKSSSATECFRKPGL